MTDLQEMLCADALATSRSTMEELTMFHSRATKLYGVRACREPEALLDIAPSLSMVLRSRQDADLEVSDFDLQLI